MTSWLARNFSWARVSLGLYPYPRERIQPVSIGAFRGWQEKDAAPRLMPLLHELLEGDLIARGRIIHEDRHKTSSLCTPACRSGHDSVYVKRYQKRGLLMDLKDWVRGSQARKSFLLGLELPRRGIATTPPLAYLEHWRGGIRREGFLLCKGYPSGIPVAGMFTRFYKENKAEDFDVTLRALGAFFLAVERAAVRHGSLMGSTLAVPNDEGPPSLYLTDLEEICTLGAVCEHDYRRMAWSIHWHLKRYLPPERIEAFCEEGRRIGCRILQRVSLYL